MVDEVFRPCREGDLAVMQWVAGYVKKAYFELCPVGVVRSKEIDDAVRSITVMGAPYLSLIHIYWQYRDLRGGSPSVVNPHLLQRKGKRRFYRLLPPAPGKTMADDRQIQI